MNLTIVAAAVAVVLVLVGAIWWLRRPRAPEGLDESVAMERASIALSGFKPRAALVGHDRRAALVRTADGRLAVLATRAGCLTAREIAWAQVRATEDGMLIDTGDRLGGAALIVGVSALDVAVFRRT